MRFLSNILATILGLFIFMFLGIVIVGVIISAASSEKEVAIAENSILHLKLNSPIVERAIDDPFNELEILGGEGSIGLVELKEAILNAKDDDKIKGIYLESQFIGAGFASLEEIRNALLDFKSSGKFILAYGEFFSEGDYYLVSVADNIALNPQGVLEFNGLSSEVVFLKGMLDKLGIEPEIFKVGDYKSAVETFTRTDMSEESRIQVNSFINSIYDVYLDNVAEARGVTLNSLVNISDSMLVRSPEDAVELKLVDRLAYQDEVYSDMKERLDIEEEEDLELVKLSQYRKSFKNTSASANRISVIVASGTIVSGKGDDNSIGSDKFAEEIRKARKDDKVKAVVLRINSPGGSAVASDVIWREVVLTSKEKPVIASMSDVAASGGYYIAMGCDTIVAQPNTITGSIGIFSMLFNAKEFLNEKLGITTDVVNTGEFSDIYTVTRPLSEFEKSILQKDVGERYEVFVGKAAEGRDMSVGELKKVASGRVWSGVEAKDNGLVDILGGLNEAISIAAGKAGISDDYKVNYYPRQKNFFEQVMSDLGQDVETRYMQYRFGDMYPLVKKVKELEQIQGVQALMPYTLRIQ